MNNRQKHGMIATNMNKHPYFCSQFLIVKWKIKIRIQGVFEVEVFLLTCDSMRCSKEF
jgi:hypothetical protein